MNTTKIVQEISVEEYTEILSRYKDKIVISPHALDHLSLAQRNVFKYNELISTITKEKPRCVGLQKNGRYAVYFRRSEGFQKIIFEAKPYELEIITFMNTDTFPNLKRIQHDE